jgi:hypothetical protein
MPAIVKRDRKINLQFLPNTSASTLGGLPAVEALAQRFGLWKKLAGCAALDPRKRKGRGFGPEVMCAQIIYTLCSGGESLADSEELNDEPLVREFSGIERFADQTTMGEWLRAQTLESLAELRALNRKLVQWTISQAQPGRWLHAGQREFFFDDTQLEVSGASFEGAGFNYEGKRALSWQTLWMGPFLLDGQVGSPGDVSSALKPLLQDNQPFWQGQPAYFYADSASSAAGYLQAIDAQGWQWSVSYNKFAQSLERMASEFPDARWSERSAHTLSNGAVIDEQYTWLRHLPEGAAQPILFACVRRKTRGEMFWRYHFIACDANRQGDPKLAFERHHLKGDKEKLFSEVLSGLDLHHPPCAELLANQIFYALATIAYNLLIALKLLYLPDERQGWRIKTLLKHLIILPAHLVRHARSVMARVWVPPRWFDWWRAVHERIWATA